MEVGWGGGLVITVVVTWVVGAYCYWCVRALPIGVPRLLASIPVLVVYASLPLIFNRQTHLIGVGAYFCIFTWVGSFKLLLFCWNQGPGCEPWVSASFPRFAIVMSFPAHIKRKGRVVKKIPESGSWFVHLMESETWSMLLVRSGVKVILLGYLLNHVFPMRDSIPKNVMLGLYCIQLYLFATILLETLGAIANSVFGVELEPHFDNPLMATSLEEFWARRWNLLVSNMLRETVYNPVYWLLKTRQQKLMAPVANQTSSEQQSGTFGATNLQSAPGIKSRSSIQEGISKAQQQQQQQVAEKKPESQFDIPKFYAMLAAFFVSGLAHELAVYYMTLKVTVIGPGASYREVTIMAFKCSVMFKDLKPTPPILKEVNVSEPKQLVPVNCSSKSQKETPKSDLSKTIKVALVIWEDIILCTVHVSFSVELEETTLVCCLCICQLKK